MRKEKKYRPFFVLSIVTLLYLACGDAAAQQRAQFTQYMFNNLVINPAYAGAEEALSLTVCNRNQWVGVDGAPNTQTFSGHSLFKNEHVGLGATIINDQVGIHKNTSILASSAYHLKVAQHSYLSMGLQAGINHKVSNYNSLSPTDPKLSYQGISQTSLDLGVGFYFRSPRVQVGLSAPELIPGRTSLNDTSSIKLNKAHYFLFSKYRLPLGNDIDLEPSVLLKYLHGVPVSFDLNANVVIRKVLTLGLSYRKSESVDFLWRAAITQQLRLGYAYDYPVGNISTISNGTHELMVNYIFKYSESKIATLR